ncbi:MAG: PH domain-containing protein [Eubacteriales bacterium]|nr:PH domain-containing protein [Eubacteriales bacterium]
MSLRTAEEMYQYCLDNNFGSGMTKKWGEKHFQLIADNLAADEDVLICFIGLHNYISATKHDGNFAYALTNKRLICAQKRMIGEAFQTIALEKINDITTQTGIIYGAIVIDSQSETLNVCVDKDTIRSISAQLHDKVISAKQQNSRPQAAASASINIDVEQLTNLKILLDTGVITQEDFDLAKNKMLGI